MRLIPFARSRYAEWPERQLRLIGFPHAGGTAAQFHAWETHLPGVELLGIELPGHGTRMNETATHDLGAVLDEVLPWLRSEGGPPFAFFGHSFGGWLAFVVARELRRLGAELPVHLFVSAAAAPQVGERRVGIADRPDEQFLSHLRSFGGTPDELWHNASFMQVALPAIRADMKMLESWCYEEEPALSIPITAYGGADDPEVLQGGLAAWRTQTTRRFAHATFQGGHFYFEDSAPEFFKRLRRDLHHVTARVVGTASG